MTSSAIESEPGMGEFRGEFERTTSVWKLSSALEFDQKRLRAQLSLYQECFKRKEILSLILGESQLTTST